MHLAQTLVVNPAILSTSCHRLLNSGNKSLGIPTATLSLLSRHNIAEEFEVKPWTEAVVTPITNSSAHEEVWNSGAETQDLGLSWLALEDGIFHKVGFAHLQHIRLWINRRTWGEAGL